MIAPDRREARFRSRVESWAKRLMVTPTQVRIQRMTRKWASCSTRGRVTFSHDLIRKPRDFQDYVIAHELLHLRIPNHGKLFAATLRTHLHGNRWFCRQHAQIDANSKPVRRADRLRVGPAR